MSPSFFSYLRQPGAYRRIESPMRFVVCAFRNPLFEDGDLARLHRLCLALRRLWHQVVRIRGLDPPYKFARLRLSRNNGLRLARALFKSRLFQIESQSRFPHSRIRSMACETIARENWLHVPVEVHLRRRLRASVVPSLDHTTQGYSQGYQ